MIASQSLAELLPDFRKLGIVPDDIADGWVFPGISSFLHPCIPAMLHSHLISHSSALKISMLSPACLREVCLRIAFKKCYASVYVFQFLHFSLNHAPAIAKTAPLYGKRGARECGELLLNTPPTSTADSGLRLEMPAKLQGAAPFAYPTRSLRPSTRPSRRLEFRAARPGILRVRKLFLYSPSPDCIRLHSPSIATNRCSVPHWSLTDTKLYTPVPGTPGKCGTHFVTSERKRRVALIAPALLRLKRRVNLRVQGQEARERYGRHEHARLAPHRSYAQGVQCFRRGTVLCKSDLEQWDFIPCNECPQIKLRPYERRDVRILKTENPIPDFRMIGIWLMLVAIGGFPWAPLPLYPNYSHLLSLRFRFLPFFQGETSPTATKPSAYFQYVASILHGFLRRQMWPITSCGSLGTGSTRFYTRLNQTRYVSSMRTYSQECEKFFDGQERVLDFRCACISVGCEEAEEYPGRISPFLLPLHYHAAPYWRERGGVVVRPLASHLGEPSSIPGWVAPEFLHVRIVPYDARVFSGISRFPRPFIPALLHTHLISPSLALKSSISFNPASKKYGVGEVVSRTGRCPLTEKEFHGVAIQIPIPNYSLVAPLAVWGRAGRAVSLLAPHLGERGSIPGRDTQDFRKWESWRTMPLVGGFSRGYPVSPAFAFRRCFIFLTFHPLRLSSAICSLCLFAWTSKEAAVAEQLACTPPTEANRVQSPAGFTPRFLAFKNANSTANSPYNLISPSSALKISLRAVRISQLNWTSKKYCVALVVLRRRGCPLTAEKKKKERDIHGGGGEQSCDPDLVI
ncbi:hypothetical protein PR048_007745 [Dryococelus australis]|uniref:Uncharacterized protein n=1 Tax=Dryococelus australis TaxID=614101 RepID=A0ABQ9HV39_9NEOP|nr:hypothetical protein PR048_007745 [Dryococelus australis]